MNKALGWVSNTKKFISYTGTIQGVDHIELKLTDVEVNLFKVPKDIQQYIIRKRSKSDSRISNKK